MEIKKPEDWWALLEAHWQNILQCFSLAGLDVAKDKPLRQQLEDAKARKDYLLLHTLLNKCWCAAPDKPVIHTWPSWGVLCDLCSEIWVFDPEEEDAGS